MTPDAREKLRTQLMADEGFVPHAYQDSEGYWSVGHGLLIDQRRGGGITLNESTLLLDNRVGIAIRDLRATYPWFDALDDVRQAVIANMRYNLGAGGFAAFHHLHAALAQRDYAAAANEMLASRWTEQVKTRAIRLATQMRSGAW